MHRGTFRSRLPREGLLTLGAICLIGGLARLSYGAGFVNFDAMWSLVWGRQLAGLRTPTYEVVAAPTPHPLSTVLGVVLSPLGTHAELALHVLAFATIGALVYATGLLAYRALGVAAAVIAPILLLTRTTVAFYGPLAYLDVAFAALVVWAVALEAGRRRRGAPVMVLLCAAGLLRPEAWLLGGGYLLWLWSGLDRHAKLRLGLLALLAPCAWAFADLAVTGDPAFSFTHTRAGAVELHSTTGLGGLLRRGPRMLGQELRPEVLIAALAGYALCTWIVPRRLLLAWTAAAGAAFSVPVIIGSPLNARYLMPVIALACVAAAGALTAWRRSAGAVRRPWLVAAFLLAGVLVTTGPGQQGRLARTRADLATSTQVRSAAHDLVRGGVPCLPLTTPTPLLTPLIRIWTGLPISVIRSTGPAQAHGSFVVGPATALANAQARPGGPSEPPPGASLERRSGPWALSARCARR